MAKSIIKSPLIINIFWHNASEEMYLLANKLYGFFLRNPKNPLDRHLGIAVNIYPFIPSQKELELRSFHNSANIILVDNEMNCSKKWEFFVDKLIIHTNNLGEQNHRVFPIAIDEFAHKFTKKIQQINFINLFEIDKSRKNWYLLLLLTHEVCRLLYEEERANKAKKRPSKAPIKLFISHAKKDSVEIAKNLRSHIHKIPGLSSFFDAMDIASGFQFSEELEANIENSILIAIHTDEYSSREWCRKEVLLAKKHNRPVIVVNQLNRGELRSFPYIGNVPHINVPNKWDETNKGKILDLIVLEALREALKIKYHSLKIKCLSKAFKKKVKTILSYPPELMSLVNLKKAKGIVLYPDPPLGQEELHLLQVLRPDLDFITPTSLPLVSNQGSYKSLKGAKIAISLSEINHSEKAWIQNMSIQDLMVEVTRYLLVGGVQLIYSGDINYEPPTKDGFNFSKLLIDLVKTYQYSYEQREEQLIKPIENFVFYPFSKLLTAEKVLPNKNIVNFHKVEPPKKLKLISKTKDVKKKKAEEVKLAEEIREFDTFDKKYVWAKSLSAMRIQTIEPCNALIVLGGKWLNFKGKMPGILEEALLGLRYNKPIFIIGGFGGVAAEIINALKGEQPKKLTIAYYETHYSSYAYFLDNFNEDSLTETSEKVDYQKIVSHFNKLGQSKTSSYGLNNGLSRKENNRLFKSQNEIEIISLILKGLQNIRL